MKSSLEPADDVKYSQLAPMAVVSLLLGIASLLALIGPLFFLIPLAAIGIALIALGKIRQSDGALSGSRLAHAGIALATICIVAAAVRGEVRDRLLKEQAGATAERWLGMMTAGEIVEARDLLTGAAAGSLVPRPEPGTEPRPAEELERMARERLEQDPLVRDYADVDQPLIRVETLSEPAFDAGRTIVAATLLVGDPSSGSHRHVQLQLARNKFYEAEGEPWRVDRWEAGAAHGAH